MINQLRRDLMYALRMLRRNAGFATLVIGGLAVGIAANSAIYSLIEAVMLRKLAVARPDELVALGLTTNVNGSGSGTPGAIMYSYPLYRDVRDANDVFTGLIATGAAGRLDLRMDSATVEPEHPAARFVSGNYFGVLGIGAALGRTLGPADDAPDSPPSVTISYDYWTRRFQNSPSVLGRTMTIEDVPVTITGVAARGYTGEVIEASADLWLPIALRDQIKPHDRVLDDRSGMWLLLIGRAKPELTLAQIRQRLVPVIRRSILAHATAKQLSRLSKRELEYPISSAAHGLSRVRAEFTAPLETLMTCVALLLCIVCVNIANLLLARGVGRRREIVLRLALGAQRSQILRQLLTESAVIALFGGITAVILAWWSSQALLALAGAREALSLSIGPDARILCFTLGVSLSSVLLFGVVPAIRVSRVTTATAMRESARHVAGGKRFGFSLLAAQVALCLVLLGGAIALARGLHAAVARDLGFDRDHIIVAKLDIQQRGYAGTRLAAAASTLRDRIASLPGVRAVTFSENGLFDHSEWSSTIGVTGSAPLSYEDSLAATDGVGAGYATGIGAHLLAGRDLTISDGGHSASVALVNESFARFYFHGQNAIGQLVHFDKSTALRIVGVVSDVRGQSLEQPSGHYARRLYYPYLHGDDTTGLGQPSELRLIVRTSADPAMIGPALRRMIASTAPTLPIEDFSTLPALIRESIQGERLVTEVAGTLAVLASVLAAIGLFGVMSYSVARRTGEIGIRMALGAVGANVGGMVIREAMLPVVLGLAFGVPLLWIATTLLRQRLTLITAPILLPAAAASAVLIATAAVAAFLPARQATRIDPLEALRQE